VHRHDGYSIVACDLNGDGIEDFISGADNGGGLNQRFMSGEVSVVFGRRGRWSGRTTVDQRRDVLISGAENFDLLGTQTACGDVDGDGLGDAIVSAFNAKGPAHERPPQAGDICILFGREQWPAEIDLLTSSEVTIYGPNGNASIGGRSISTGDINGDGFDDVLIDYTRAGPTSGGTGQGFAGRVLVLFGRASWNSEIDLALGADLELRGHTEMEFFGSSLDAADLDRDGTEELLVAAAFADGPGDIRADCGEVSVFKGRSVWPSLIDLATSSADLTFFGADIEDRLSNGTFAVDAGDIDGNGWPELIAGVSRGDGRTNAAPESDEMRIIEPRTQLNGTRDARTQSKISIYGPQAGDRFGVVSLSADVHGDGCSDIIGSAQLADGADEARPDAGEIQIIFGRPGFPAVRELGLFPEYQVIGEFPGDELAPLTSSGVNADGLADVLAASAVIDNDRPPIVWVISPFDVDGDGFQQLADNCPLVANPVQTDSDADLIGDICDGDYDLDSAADETDCRPSDRLQGRPGDVPLTSTVKSGTSLTLTWKAAASAESYDVTGGLLSQLAPSNYRVCQNARDPNLTDTTFVEPELPPASDGFFFLVRGRDSGCGGVGTWGRDAYGMERVNASSERCP
jgi:hypothetical protein